jgi:carboxyl-terminal processing protease
MTRAANHYDMRKYILIGTLIGACCFLSLAGVGAVSLIGFNTFGAATPVDTGSTAAPTRVEPQLDATEAPERAVEVTSSAPVVPAPRSSGSTTDAWPIPLRPTAPAATPDAAIDAAEKSKQRALWEEVWRTVDTHYYDPRYRGIDWAATRSSLMDEIETGLSRERFYERVFETVDRLNDDHTEFNSPLDLAQIRMPDGQRGWTGTGILAGINFAERRLYVRKVIPGSPADRAGVTPHMQILAIDDQPAVIDDQPVTWRYRLNFQPGAKTRLTLRTPGGEQRDVALTQVAFAVDAEEITGRMVPGPRKILYINLPTLNETFISGEFAAILTQEMDRAGGALDGVILDLRTCPGGSERNMVGVLGRLTEPAVIGENIERDGSVTPVEIDTDIYEAIGNSRALPIAILISRDTNSAAEILAGVLKHRHPQRVTLGVSPAGWQHLEWTRSDARCARRRRLGYLRRRRGRSRARRSGRCPKQR